MKIVMAERLALRLSLTHANLLGRAQNKHFSRIQNPFIKAQSTQIESVISVPIKDFIHHYPRELFNDIPSVSAHFYDIPGSRRTFTTYPGRGALLRHTRVGTQFNDIPGSDFGSKKDIIFRRFF